MLSRKTSFLFNAAVITLLISGSHTTFAAVSENNRQLTEAQKAADKAREDRLAEMRAAIGKRADGEATPGIKASSEPEKKAAEELKPTPMVKPHALPHAASSDKPVHQHRTLQEQIALNKQKKAEELHKLHEMNKGKAAEGSAKPMTWQERAKLAREKREAAMKGSVAEKEGVEVHTKPPAKEEPKPLAMSPTQKRIQEELERKGTTKSQAEHHKAGETTHPTVNLANPSLKMTTEEHEHTVKTLPMPEKGAPKAHHMGKTQERMMAEQEKSEPSATSQTKADDEPMKRSLTPPPPPKGGPKPPAMSLTQKKPMAEQEKAEPSATDKPKLSFLDEIKKRGETPATAG